MSIRTFVAMLALAASVVVGSVARGQKMYWSDSGNHRIQRANLDGSEVEDVVVEVGRPADIAIDAVSGKN